MKKNYVQGLVPLYEHSILVKAPEHNNHRSLRKHPYKKTSPGKGKIPDYDNKER